MLINLARNALKFTKDGFVTILASYCEKFEQLVIQVIDSGVGIEQAEIPLLCKKFGKLMRTAEMNSEGVGLGLMISKSLVEANGGSLEISSEGFQKGATFKFSMKMQTSHLDGMPNDLLSDHTTPRISSSLTKRSHKRNESLRFSQTLDKNRLLDDEIDDEQNVERLLQLADGEGVSGNLMDNLA